MKEGVNTIRLESITSEGGPNLDQMCFNVENISLYDERESIQRHKQEKFSFSIESGNLFSLVDGNAEVVVMNVEGKLLFKQHQKVNAGMNRFAVNKNHLPAGVYLVQLKINQKMISVFQWNLR